MAASDQNAYYIFYPENFQNLPPYYITFGTIDLLKTREAINLICPKSVLGDIHMNVMFFNWTGRPLSITLESRWSRQSRCMAILGKGERKVPTKVAFPSGALMPLAWRRNESKYWFWVAITVTAIQIKIENWLNVLV